MKDIEKEKNFVPSYKLKDGHIAVFESVSTASEYCIADCLAGILNIFILGYEALLSENTVDLLSIRIDYHGVKGFERLLGPLNHYCSILFPQAILHKKFSPKGIFFVQLKKLPQQEYTRFKDGKLSISVDEAFDGEELFKIDPKKIHELEITIPSNTNKKLLKKTKLLLSSFLYLTTHLGITRIQGISVLCEDIEKILDLCSHEEDLPLPCKHLIYWDGKVARVDFWFSREFIASQLKTGGI